MNRNLQAFKQKLAKGDYVLGPFSKSSDPAFIEASGHAGFDFIILDLEHGPNNILSLQNLIRAAEISGILPLVRVPFETPSDLARALDVGAAGLQIPQVDSAQQVKEILKLTKFAPGGDRGVCRFVRAAGYSSTDRQVYFREANENLIILQLEGKKAIDNLDEIIAVPGIDILFIGPYDLSQSLGVAGQVDHPAVIAEMEKICRKCKEKGVVVGTFTDTLAAAERWKKAGVQYLSYSVDVGLYHEACAQLVQAVAKL